MRELAGPDAPTADRPKLRKAARVTVFMDPFARTRAEGTARLIRYEGSPIGRAPLQRWRVEMLTVFDTRGRELTCPAGERPVARLVHPDDVLQEAAE